MLNIVSEQGSWMAIYLWFIEGMWTRSSFVLQCFGGGSFGNVCIPPHSSFLFVIYGTMDTLYCYCYCLCLNGVPRSRNFMPFDLIIVLTLFTRDVVVQSPTPTCAGIGAWVGVLEHADAACSWVYANVCSYALFGSICTCAIDIVTLKTKVFCSSWYLILVTHQLRGTVGAYGASLPLRPLVWHASI